MEEKENIKLNDKDVTLEEVQKAKDNLNKNQKLVETEPGNFHILEKIYG